MNREEIKNILPHRDDMLLLDELRIEEDIAVGSYTIKGDEFFLRGHFPGNPVVPGVILCEMMGQSSAILLEKSSGYTPYFTSMNNVKFKRKVLPGDTVVLKRRVEKGRGNFYFVKCEGCVEDKLCVRAELSFALMG